MCVEKAKVVKMATSSYTDKIEFGITFDWVSANLVNQKSAIFELTTVSRMALAMKWQP